MLVFLNEWLLLVVVLFGLGGSIGNSPGLFQPFPPAACVCPPRAVPHGPPFWILLAKLGIWGMSLLVDPENPNRLKSLTFNLIMITLQQGRFPHLFTACVKVFDHATHCRNPHCLYLDLVPISSLHADGTHRLALSSCCLQTEHPSTRSCSRLIAGSGRGSRACGPAGNRLLRSSNRGQSLPGRRSASRLPLIHAAANFAAFFAFRGLSINESTFCFMVWK